MIEHFLLSWEGLGPETKAAAIGGASTLLAAVVGAIVIFFQIGRQGKLNRESVAENERRRLKSKMYEEVEAACDALADAHSVYQSKLLIATQELQLAAYTHRDGRNYSIPRARIMELVDLNGKFQAALIGLIFLIERRQFIAPNILVFRSALNAAAYGASETFHKKLFPSGMTMFPADRPDGEGIYPYIPPTPDDADALHSLALTVIGHLHDVIAYAEDFSVEMQNLLVADLFGTTVLHRRPIDPNIRVVKIEDTSELEHYFNEETEWGRWAAAEEAKVAERIKGNA